MDSVRGKVNRINCILTPTLQLVTLLNDLVMASGSNGNTFSYSRQPPIQSQSPSTTTLGQGRVPVISSGRDARTVSSKLRTVESKGKEKEILDLTMSDEEEEEDLIIVNEYPICIGQLTSLALILYPLPELNIPPAVPVDLHPGPILPVHVYRAQKVTSGINETLKLLTPKSQQVFGMVEQKAANVLGPLLGDGYSGTGVVKGSLGKIWCEAAVVRRPERNVRI